MTLSQMAFVGIHKGQAWHKFNSKQVSCPIRRSLHLQVRAPRSTGAAQSTVDRGDDPVPEIVALAVPTSLALAIEPIGSLISTGFVGHLGPTQLAGVGVSLSVYNSFTKLFNMPLLAIITSSIASSFGQNDKYSVSNAVLSSIALALLVGTMQSAVLFSLGSLGLQMYGAGAGSELYGPASKYLSVRILGNAISVLFISLLGIFRGLGDTFSPLIATVCFASTSVLLEYLFLFSLGLETSGAALAVVIAQMLASCVQIFLLKSKVSLNTSQFDFKMDDEMKRKLQLTFILMWRTLAVMAVYAVGCGILARFGGSSVASAAHQIAFQIWLASSLLSDSLAVAAQSLIARSLSENNRTKALRVSHACISMAVYLGIALTGALTLASYLVPHTLFTTNEQVIEALKSIMPLVIGSQIINAVAFVMDGIVYGVGTVGFKYAARSMVMSAIPSIAVMLGGLLFCQRNSLGTPHILWSVWLGLMLLMICRAITMLVPFYRKLQPFDVFAFQ